MGHNGVKINPLRKAWKGLKNLSKNTAAFHWAVIIYYLMLTAFLIVWPPLLPLYLTKGTFTHGVTDSSVEFPNIILGIEDLKFTYHAKFMLS